MRKYSKFIAALVFYLLLTAPSTAQHHTQLSDPGPLAHKGFITPSNAVAMPASGEVPRDSYGRPQTYQHLNRKLPEFTAPFSNGVAFNSDTLVGRWSVIRVWGPWCHDSMNDQPFAQELAAALEDRQDVVFLGLMTARNAAYSGALFGKFGSLDAYYAESGDTTNNLVDADASARENLSIAWTPSYLIVDPHLRVVGFRTELAVDGDQAVQLFLNDLQAMIDAGRG